MPRKFNFLFVLFIFLMSNCSPSPSTDTLTVTMSLGEEEWKVMRTYVFPEFERRHKITIKSYQIESGQLATKLEALKLADKSEIDVFAQDNMNLSILVAKNLILDLSDYRKDIPHKVLPNLIEACTFDKKLLFMPLRPNVQITYYNEDAFKKYNLLPPMTWGELINASKLFKEKEGVGRVLIKGYGGNSTATQLYELISQAGGNPYEKVCRSGISVKYDGFWSYCCSGG